MSMEPIRTVIADDEPDAREGIAGLLRQHPEVVVVGEADTGRAAVDLIEQLRPDLIFLDIQMPELDGFGVLATVGPARMPVIVFVTAYDEYALRAFEVQALDYLLKPFSDARFAEAMRMASVRVRQRRAGVFSQQLGALLDTTTRRATGEPSPTAPSEAAYEPSLAGYLERIMVRTGRQVSVVRVLDIDWIEADGYYARLHVAGRAHLVRETLKHLCVRLDPGHFIRVHRAAIVNIERVHSLQASLEGRHVVILKDGTRVALSRSRRTAFQRALGWPA